MQISWYIWLLTNEFLQLFLVKSRGSAIAKIIGHNVVKHSEQFETQVSMWVFEELIDGRKLTEIINETHENVKYLPKHILPENVVSKKKICYWLLIAKADVYSLFLGCCTRCRWSCKRCWYFDICCTSSIYHKTLWSACWKNQSNCHWTILNQSNFIIAVIFSNLIVMFFFIQRVSFPSQVVASSWFHTQLTRNSTYPSLFWWVLTSLQR